MKSSLASQMANADSPALFGRSVWGDSDTLGMLLGMDGTIVDITQPMAEKFGKPVVHLRGSEVWQYLSPDIRAEHQELLQRVVASRKSQRIETSGNGRWQESVLRPCFGDNGDVVGVSMVTSDVTERCKARNDLAQSEQRLRLSLQSTKVGLWELDLDGRTAWRSSEHAEIFGYEPDELGRWAFDDFIKHVYPEDRPMVESAIREGLASGTGWTFECRIVRRDSKVRWIFVRSAAAASPGSTQRNRVSGILIDITERKQAQMEAQESVRRFAVMADVAPVLIWTSGLDKLCDFFNQPWLDFTGRTLRQELGNGWTEGVHPDDLAICFGTYASSFEARRPFRSEFRLRRHDGEYRWIADSGVPRFNDDGSFAGYIGSGIDITDQRRDRESLARAAMSAEKLRASILALNACTDLDSALKCLVLKAVEIGGMDCGVAYVVEGDHAVLRHQVGLPSEFVAQVARRPLTTEYVAAVLAEPHGIFDVLKRFPHRRQLGEAYDLRHVYCVGLATDKGAFGYLNVVTRQSAPPPASSLESIRILALEAGSIFARLQAKAQLRLLNAQQQVILNATPLGIGHVIDRRIVWVNPAHDHILGYNPGESRSMDTALFYAHEEDYLRVGKDSQECFSRGECYSTEARMKKKDGALFWCRLFGRAVNPAAPSEGAIWLLQDVTELRRGEEKMRLQSEMLSRMKEGVLLVRASDATIMLTNAKFDAMLGYAEGELSGQKVSIVNAPGEPSAEESAAITEQLRRTGSWEGEIVSRGKDSSGITCHVTVTRFDHSEFGEVWLSVHTDITARREMEESLRQAINRYDELVQRIPSGVYQFRVCADGGMRMDYASQRTGELLGVAVDTLLADATTWARCVHPDEQAGVAQAVKTAAESVTAMNWVGRFVVQGETRWLRIHGRPVSQPNGDVVWNGVVNDLTESKRLETALRQAQKLEGIGHLAGGMAHEFNNILAGMMMNLSLAKLGGEEVDLRELLNELDRSCKRSAELIKQVLAFSRQSVMSQRSLDLAEVVSGQVRTLRPFLGERVEIDLALPGGLPQVRADKSLIEQVLLNLCHNARDAMKDGGRLRVELSLEQVEPERTKTQIEARAGQYVRLSVSDTGCGMDESTMTRLFEPFFTTKGVGQGMGLGLAAVRGIAQQHQGWVEVDSRPGQGSTFRVYLPATEGAKTARAPMARVENTVLGQGTILIVEDEARLREVTRKVLTRRGYKVLEAIDGTSAMALWAAHRTEIDLLYTDMVMPGHLSGLQVAERVMAEKPGVRVIITSGYNTDILDIEKAVAASIVYLPKPCPPDLLFEAISRCLQPKLGTINPAQGDANKGR